MRTPFSSRLAGVALVALVGLGAAGCQSTVSTHVQVTGSTTSSVVAAISIDGDAAAVIAKQPGLVASLNRVLSGRLKRPEAVVVTSSLVSWSDTLSYAELVANSDVLGVSSLSLTSVGGQARVQVGVVVPRALEAALAKGVSGQSDAVSQLATMRQYTKVSMIVSFPGPAVVSAVSPEIAPKASGTTVTLTQPLAGYHDGRFIAQGALSGGTDWALWGGLVAGALVLLVLWRAAGGAGRRTEDRR